MISLCLAGLVSGFTITTGAARAVTEPLRTIREALERVEAGDLAVQVPVDDGSEVGQLQAGFNRMVAGLRQRRTLEDLFGRYVGTEVADQALRRGPDLGGERRHATILFVDLIGSTAMALALPPEEVVANLNAYFAAVVDAVQAEGGWVNKFEGDGALCVFGPPGPSADHAAAGLRAGIRVRAAVREAAVLRRHLVAAIGVSTGLVVAGTIGSTARFEYTVIGDPVNEAARLTELAKDRPGGLLASGRCVAAAGAEGAAWNLADEVTLRGRSRPTPLYTPSDPGPVLMRGSGSDTSSPAKFGRPTIWTVPWGAMPCPAEPEGSRCRIRRCHRRAGTRPPKARRVGGTELPGRRGRHPYQPQPYPGAHQQACPGPSRQQTHSGPGQQQTSPAPYPGTSRATVGVFAHLAVFASIIVTLILFLVTDRADRFNRGHAAEALNFQITLLIASLVIVVVAQTGALSRAPVLRPGPCSARGRPAPCPRRPRRGA